MLKHKKTNGNILAKVNQQEVTGAGSVKVLCAVRAMKEIMSFWNH